MKKKFLIKSEKEFMKNKILMLHIKLIQILKINMIKDSMIIKIFNKINLIKIFSKLFHCLFKTNPIKNFRNKTKNVILIKIPLKFLSKVKIILMIYPSKILLKILLLRN